MRRRGPHRRGDLDGLLHQGADVLDGPARLALADEAPQPADDLGGADHLAVGLLDRLGHARQGRGRVLAREQAAGGRLIRPQSLYVGPRPIAA